MPRSGKGGAREGSVGQAYSNRTDLNGGKMPVTAAPNQGYGEAGAQRAAQSAVPMGTPSVSTASPQNAPQGVSAPFMSAPSAPLPSAGSMPHLDPTMRPDEPITAGAPYGPGPDFITPPPMRLSQSLGAFANSGNATSTLMDLAATARNMGL
jgi:hypothetical protein